MFQGSKTGRGTCIATKLVRERHVSKLEAIEDYQSHAELATAELGALASVWREQRRRLRNQEAYSRFEEKLKARVGYRNRTN